MTGATCATNTVQFAHPTVVREHELSRDAEFQTRRFGVNPRHARELAMALKRGCKLPPVTLWRNPEKPNDALTVLDGFHRLEALTRTGVLQREGVEAVIVECPRQEALRIATQANVKDALPLTSGERGDAAWRLVREGGDLSKAEIARLAGISPRTVATMRDVWRTFQEKGWTAEGIWRRDKNCQPPTTDEVDRELRQREREQRIKEVAEQLQQAAGWLANTDEEAFIEALDVAFGVRLKRAVDHLFNAEILDIAEYEGYDEEPIF